MLSQSISRSYFPSISFLLVLLILSPGKIFGEATVRLKDITRISGSREYQAIGYGLVTGLDGTGDKSNMSIEMVRGMLQNMGMDVAKSDIQSKNCAAVMVTAMLPPFGKPGDKFDITVSSIGDAKSLQGGVLMPTLLKGGDGQSYAVAQGQISVGGLGEGGGSSQSKNHLLVGRVPGGAIQDRDVGDGFGQDGTFSLLLANKEVSTARKIKEAIDEKFGEGWAKILDPGTVKVTIPQSFKDDPVSFAASIETLSINIERPNRVVINERTGTIIVGNNVRISEVVISQGGLRIEIAGQPQGAKPAAMGKNAPKGSMISIQGESTVDDIVKALNAVGATPRDLVAIFQAIDAAGALHGELKLI